MNLLFPIIFVAVFIVLFVVIVIKSKNNNYDERQLIMRNRAFKYSFFALIGYVAVCGILDLCDIYWADTAVQMFYGLFLGIIVFFTFSVFNDAFFKESKKQLIQTLLFYISIDFIQLYNFISNISESKLIENGMLTETAIPLGLAVTFGCFTVITIIKLIVEKVRKDED